MIKLINKFPNNQKIKKAKGGEYWYVLDTQYIAEKLMADRTYMQLSFELFTKRLIINNLSLIKVVLAMSFILTVLGFIFNLDIVNVYINHSKLMGVLAFLFALFLNSLTSAVLLIILSFISHIPGLAIDLLRLIKFNVLRIIHLKN